MRFIVIALSIIASPGWTEGQVPWSYSTFFGGIGTDTARTVRADRAGNTYIAGLAQSGPSGPFEASGIFLAKFDGDGKLVYTKVWRAGFSVYGMHIDDAGNVYLVGLTNPTFPTTPGSYQPNSANAGLHGYVLKLAPDGSTIFSTFLSPARPTVINTDAEGNVMVCGTTPVAGFPLTREAYQTMPGAAGDFGFCSKLTADGSRLKASTLFGSRDEVRGYFVRPSLPSAVSSDPDGNFVVVGSVSSAAFPVTGGLQTEDLRRSLFQSSTDSGDWVVSDSGSWTTVTSIDIDRQNPLRIFASTDTGVLLSEDGGSTWRKTSTTPTIALKVHPLNAAYQVRVTYPFYLERSSDGGMTWRSITSGSRSPVTVADPNELSAADQIAVDPSEEGAFFITTNTNTGVLRINAGTGGGRRLPISANAVWQMNPAVLYIRGGRSNDGGATFQEIPLVALKMWPSSDPNVAYGWGFLRNIPTIGMYRTNDGGDTWQNLPAFPFNRSPVVYVDSASTDIVYASGAEGGIQRSIDGGQTWEPFDSGISNGQIRTIAKDAAGNLWAGATKPDNGFITRISGDATKLLYSTLFGKSAGATINFASMDMNGRLIIGGSGPAADFPNTYPDHNSNRYAPGFIAVLSSDGTTLELSRRLEAVPSAMEIDGQGQIHLVGQIPAGALSVTPDAEQPLYGGGTSDGFWMVLDPQLDQIIHATYLGGSGSDSVSGIALLPDGRVALGGTTTSEDFLVTSNAYQSTRGGFSVPVPVQDSDAFLTFGIFSAPAQ